MHDVCHHSHNIYMYVGSNYHICFHIKHIAQAKVSSKHISNTHGGAMLRVKTMNGGGKLYRVIGNGSLL
jgi:hypothetical protein